MQVECEIETIILLFTVVCSVCFVGRDAEKHVLCMMRARRGRAAAVCVLSAVNKDSGTVRVCVCDEENCQCVTHPFFFLRYVIKYRVKDLEM